eukprot:gnl/Chilomastix_cuspidata/2899.p1 GENE.gnl/Chilomastix_cuspidata/2899~~gnl/Chilomastix_cuspidata/2899.p1  ORF type:complete len:457 (+),score=238.48 gnl/Chilomastix_cuspidata/2899:258-1628(+)
MDQDAIASNPRPGTSLRNPSAATPSSVINQLSVAPKDSSPVRPPSGYLRPSAGVQPIATHSDIRRALRSTHGGGGATMRGRTGSLQTASGRVMRLATASLASSLGIGGVDLSRLEVARYVSRPVFARLIIEFLLGVQRNPARALDLLTQLAEEGRGADWYLHYRTGCAFLRLSNLKEAERALKRAARDRARVLPFLLLSLVALRRDQPNAALDHYRAGAAAFPGTPEFPLYMARIHEQFGEVAQATAAFQRALDCNPSDPEALSCLAAIAFYGGFPDRALRFYRRLIALGHRDAGLWANVGLCFYQVDRQGAALWALLRALREGSQGSVNFCDAGVLADIWYDLGLVFVELADLKTAQQCFTAATLHSPTHAESYICLSALAVLRRRPSDAKAALNSWREISGEQPEGFLNSAILALNSGRLEDAIAAARAVLARSRGDPSAKSIVRQVRAALVRK